jgi:hypothetical protein
VSQTLDASLVSRVDLNVVIEAGQLLALRQAYPEAVGPPIDEVLRLLLELVLPDSSRAPR